MATVVWVTLKLKSNSETKPSNPLMFAWNSQFLMSQRKGRSQSRAGRKKHLNSRPTGAQKPQQMPRDKGMCSRWKCHRSGPAGWEHCPLQLVLRKQTLKIILARSCLLTLFPDRRRASSWSGPSLPKICEPGKGEAWEPQNWAFLSTHKGFSPRFSS